MLRLRSVLLVAFSSASICRADEGMWLLNDFPSSKVQAAYGFVQDLSTPREDYLARGFLAKMEKEERRSAHIEVDQLLSITDVTDRVLRATAGKEGEAFATASRQESARIEGACITGPEKHCEVVNLFHGGKYHLYTYRRFRDARLVFAPEFPMAACESVQPRLRPVEQRPASRRSPSWTASTRRPARSR